MIFTPLLIPQFDEEPKPLPPRQWVMPVEPTEGSFQERLDGAQSRYFRSLLYLQRVDALLLEDLQRAADEKVPLTVYVDDVEPDLERIFAVLRCAYQFRAAVTLVPGPPPVRVDVGGDGGG